MLAMNTQFQAIPFMSCSQCALRKGAAYITVSLFKHPGAGCPLPFMRMPSLGSNFTWE